MLPAFVFKKLIGGVMQAFIGKIFSSKYGLKCIFAILGVLAKRTDNTLDDELIKTIKETFEV